MKLRSILIFTSLILALAFVFSSCAENTDSEGDSSDIAEESVSETESNAEDNKNNDTPEAPDDEGDDENDPPEKTPYTVRESYLPEKLSKELAERFEGKTSSFKAVYLASGPFAFQDVYTISDCKIVSITIPVMNLYSTDDNGDFTFTIHKIGNSYNSMKVSPTSSYAIKINAKKYSLEPNTEGVYKMIKVDVSEYNIELTNLQTVAFGATGDSLIPAYLAKDNLNLNLMSRAYKQQFPQATGILQKIGTGFSTIPDILCYDLELERTYASEDAYKAAEAEEQAYKNMVSELKAKYSGKTVSILGDSISTFKYVSNNTHNNATTGGNAIYYPNADYNVYDYRYTYWGRLLTDLGMELCVNNSWSSSRVYGRANTSDSMPLRATELDNDNGTPDDPSDDISPDVIIVYMGINDLQNDSPFGDLYAILEANDGRTDNEKISAWFDTVKAQAEAAGDSIVMGSTYTTFEQAYALGLNSMKEKYPNAELYCMTLVQTYDTNRCNAQQIGEYNRCISALAEYFGATVIDQYSSDSERTFRNVHAYSTPGDGHCIHPSSKGHELMERLIVKTMYKKNTAN